MWFAAESQRSFAVNVNPEDRLSAVFFVACQHFDLLVCQVLFWNVLACTVHAGLCAVELVFADAVDAVTEVGRAMHQKGAYF